MGLDVYLEFDACPVCGSSGSQVYSDGITHNLNDMAGAAGVYSPMWHPPEGAHARDLIEPLKAGLEKLRADPVYFRSFNPPNKWGDYEGLVGFVERYLAACERYPNALVRASR